VTESPTDSPTLTPSATPSSSSTISPTSTASPTATPSLTLTLTPSLTQSPLPTATPTVTSTRTPTATLSQTPLPTATSTQTLLPTLTVTPQLGPPGSSSFDITLYNPAGELIRDIALKQPLILGSTLGDFTIEDPTFAPQAGQQAVILVNGQTFLWNGSNNNGQQVSSGIYYVKLSSTDSNGNLIVYTHEVVVLAVGNLVQVRIFNSAGEEVRTLASYAYGSQQPTRLQPDVTSMAFGPDPSMGSKINFDLGGLTVPWDGTNALGQRVASGTYTVQLVSQSMGGGASIIATTSVTVINASGGVLAGSMAGPNPMLPSDTVLWLRVPNAPAGTHLIARLYNLAGELIMTARNDLQPDRLSFDMGGRPVSGGVYIMSVTAVAPWGEVERRNYKMVLVR
jgi:hypothetical protein